MRVVASVELSAHYERLQSSVLNIPDRVICSMAPTTRPASTGFFALGGNQTPAGWSTITPALGLNVSAPQTPPTLNAGRAQLDDAGEQYHGSKAS